MKITGHFDRRGFLQLSGLLGAGMMMPRMSFAAEGDLLRIRSDSDITRLDPAYEIGTRRHHQSLRADHPGAPV